MWKRRPNILLCPNIPAPLHGVAPRAILGRAWWEATRQAAFRKTNYRCTACGVHKDRAKRHHWMEGHELYLTEYEKGRATYIETVGLCHYCHNFIHDGRLTALMTQGELAQSSYMAIIHHGTRVLREAGLSKASWKERDQQLRLKEQQGLLPAWKNWRLVLFGKEYKPLYKNELEWEQAHARND